MECTNLVGTISCRIRTILHIYPRRSVPKTDCQPKRRSILDSIELLAIVLSVLFRYTDSDYPLLQTLLVESGVNHHPHNHINQTLIFHQSQYEFLNQGVKIDM
jgi:hypothetical protein